MDKDAENEAFLQASVVGGGPTVVLLHGQPGSGADWQWVLPLIADHHQVVVPDRPGYGRTGGAATGYRGNAAAVVRLLDRLGCDRAVIAAHSWAGGVALDAALAYPDRVCGLVLVSSVGPGQPLHWDDRLLAAPYVGEIIAAATIGGVGRLVANRRVRRLAERRLAGRARDGFVALDRLTRDHAPVWRSFVIEQRAMLTDLNRLASDLGRIDVPTALVHGARDHLIPLSVAESLHGAIRGSKLTVVPDLGHLLPHDRPVAVADAIVWVTAQTAR